MSTLPTYRDKANKPGEAVRVKDLARNVGDLDRVLDLEPSTLSRCGVRQHNADAAGKTQDQRGSSDKRGALQVDRAHDGSLPGTLAVIIPDGKVSPPA